MVVDQKLKNWDYIVVQAYGEDSFDTSQEIRALLYEHGYTDVQSGSGRPANASPWFAVHYERPVEEE